MKTKCKAENLSRFLHLGNNKLVNLNKLLIYTIMNCCRTSIFNANTHKVSIYTRIVFYC